MFELLLLSAAAFLLLVGYVVSVFANAVYVDPEEIEEIFPELSDTRKRQLEQFTSNPRAFFQVAFLARVSAALALGVIAHLLALQIASYGVFPAAAVFVVVFALFWLATTFFLVYFPRHISHRQAKSRLIRFLPLVNLIYLFTSPAAAMFKRLASPKRSEAVSEEKKDDIVERAIETLAESSGIATPIIEQDEKEMIHQIFQLDVTEVREIMVPRINMIAFSAETDLGTIKKVTAENGFSRYPVYSGTVDNIVGVIKVKDLLQLTHEQQEHFHLTEHMREPMRVGEQKKIDQLLAEFKKTKTHMAIVLDQFGGTAGLVTLEDVLEEIVGDIHDEEDTGGREDILRLADGTLQVDGSLPLEDLAHELNMELELDEFQTVGGLIYDLVGSVPQQGIVMNWQDCRMKVAEVAGQRIKKVIVTPPPGPIENSPESSERTTEQ